MGTPRINSIESRSEVAGFFSSKQGLINLVETSLIDCPFTTVKKVDGTNRKIVDMANDLGVRMGVERISTQQLYLVQDERGVNGESVFGVLGDKFERIRCIGSWEAYQDGWGQLIGGYNDDVIEITDYCTGLNILASCQSGPDARVSVDGGTEGSNFVKTSSVLIGRNYCPNTVYPVASGLPLGWHTFRIRKVAGSVYFSGIEILCETSTMSVRPGKIYGNRSVNLLVAEEVLNYNSNFESGSLGTKGGAVSVYLKEDGTVKKAVNPTETAAKYFSETDHSNEEIVRAYHWREFGSSRSDDFSTLDGNVSNRVFTLSDGGTTLLGKGVALYSGSGQRLGLSGSSSNYLAFTFVGTGLDIDTIGEGNGDCDNVNVYVDGVSRGVITTTTSKEKRIKICSGLEYGTHVVAFSESSNGTYDLYYYRFITYATKMPVVPETSIELTKYYVAANYVANTTAGLDTIAKGVIRKQVSQREAILFGSWSLNFYISDSIGAWEASTSTNGDYSEKTFFGTGFEIRGQSNPVRAGSVPVTINGLAATTANFPTLVSSTYGGYSFVGGVLNTAGANQVGSGASISGLPLGKYTVRFTNNTSSAWAFNTLDVITPVHFPKTQSEGAYNDTGYIGNTSLGDQRVLSLEKSSKRILAVALGTVSDPTTTSTAYIPCPDLSSVIVVPKGGAFIEMIMSGSFSNNSSASANYFGFLVDGLPVGRIRIFEQQTSGYLITVSNHHAMFLSEGVHRIEACWKMGGAGTLRAFDIQRTLTVKEI